MPKSPTQAIEPTRQNWSIDWSVVGPLIILIVFGLGFRATNLDANGFAEDEVNKVDAVHAYQRGDITANAEHPMLMKVLMYASVKVGRVLRGQAISAGHNALLSREVWAYGPEFKSDISAGV